MRVTSWTRPFRGLDWSHSLFCLTFLLWTRGMNGLADFSNYLSRIITSHSAHACDGAPLRLHCPRHSTISIQSAFYGSGEARLCRGDPPPGPRGNHSCSAFTALQKLLSECQSHRDCQLPVSHLLFGRDPCPGTTKYLHVDYKCKPTEHKKHVVCEGDVLVLRCKAPKVLNIYAAVYGRSLGQTDICPSRLNGPPPFGELIVSEPRGGALGVQVLLQQTEVRRCCRQPDLSGPLLSRNQEVPHCAVFLCTTDITEGGRPQDNRHHLISYHRKSFSGRCGRAFCQRVRQAKKLRGRGEQLPPGLRLHPRAPRNGSTAVHLQRVRRPPLHPAGSVHPSDLPRERSGTLCQVRQPGAPLSGAG
ncbi:protein eva-1 homolog C isoform X4 [Kryptolebias marmoratus]|uniref:protein eva-1 homolog C isoform X4 n=1 Tax=Kryptolebias marmoratus TaxID=37003 RepID=UPI0007F91C8E|nr:protein eva-1 homolog C isoform X4 [Kryptolebias marmoratus]